MGEFPAVVDLNTLDGTNGFRLEGIAAEHTTGFSVAFVDDLNGDGIDDLIIGSPEANVGASNTGLAHVVFGRTDGFLEEIDLNLLNGTDGFNIIGGVQNDRIGSFVSSAGDFNGDGLGDYLISARTSSTDVVLGGGATFVLFGDIENSGGIIDINTLNGNNGFRINGANEADLSGKSVSLAGDFNGDGFDDILVSADFADPNGNMSGESYLVYGSESALGPTLSLSSLSGGDGFRIAGLQAGDQNGFSLSSAGDVNGDGFDDIIVSSPGADPNGSNSGSSYVLFGRAGVGGAAVDLSTLDGTTGFRLDGVSTDDTSGFSVSNAGDVNGDGFDDLIIGAIGADPDGPLRGSSYVVFGKSGGFSSNLELSSLDGTNGFRLDGVANGDRSGSAVSAAGDVNGDGFDDIIVGAGNADPNGTSSGSSYVVFGKSVGHLAVEQLSFLDGDNGFRIDGVNGSNSGAAVSGAGDINGDGFDDVIIGAFTASPNGIFSGESYVIFGGAPGFGVTRVGSTADQTIRGTDFNDNLSGLAGDDLLVGQAGNDLLIGGSGEDELDGGAGEDRLNAGNGNDILRGGDGSDTLRGNSGDDELFGGDNSDELIGGVGSDLIYGGNGNDNFLGQGGNDTLHGEEGDDIIRGGSGNDLIFGDAGDDVLLGQGNNDTLHGGAGNDTLQGAAGSDILIGGVGDDNLTGSVGADRLDGGSGVDTLNGGGNDGARDTFVFSLGYDRDRVNAFDQNGTDRIELDDDLWTGGLTAQQVVDMFGTSNSTGTIFTFDFGGGDILEVQNAGGINAESLYNDIVII